ncbi:MAG: hypothetical protein Ct9H300mP7_5420 [Verrucomicrobiota bacterium]|nr:MAG: hypothetical protein Ct9H300mP7_5420 [Verrucomicrobiota bacterium]
MWGPLGPKRCEIQFAYAIGYPDRVCLREPSARVVMRKMPPHERVFCLNQQKLRQLKLSPIYSKTTNYGHLEKRMT